MILIKKNALYNHAHFIQDLMCKSEKNNEKIEAVTVILYNISGRSLFYLFVL